MTLKKFAEPFVASILSKEMNLLLNGKIGNFQLC